VTIERKFVPVAQHSMQHPTDRSENSRLLTLSAYEILDTPPEVIFDELVRMAASICETPIALVSLLDGQRQWFKAKVGLEAQETPQDIAFCAHAIQGTDLFVVPDAQHDKRFLSNPLVTGDPGIRFYAGAPLLTADGTALGTLCVIDTKPRELSSEKREALRLLSRHVMAQLELRRRIAELSRESKQRAQETTALLKEQQKHIERLSHYNSQTGLANRELFLQRLSRELDVSMQRGNKAALFVIELQRFDLLTEALGPSGMDTLLNEAARRVCAHANDACLAAHVRDERLALFRPNVTTATAAALFVETELLPRLTLPHRIGEHEIRPTFKIGIALTPIDGSNADTLLSAAKAALVTAKAQDAALAFASPEIATRVAGALTLEAKLRRALDCNQFVLHYQPKLNSRTGRVTGVEALLRWNDPHGSVRADDGHDALVPPARFVPLLEETGLIVPVGMWVIRQAAQDLADWRKRGIDIPRVAVNVSPMQLREKDFLTAIRHILDLHTHPVIDIEITEALLMDQKGPGVRHLWELRSAGVQVAIDDFGTGYSSLQYLARLPVDVLKIDRSFIRAMSRLPTHMAIVTNIIALAQGLGFATVAEGVETEEQSNLLRALRCDEMQGYLFSRPLDRVSLEAWLDTQQQAGGFCTQRQQD
jgi:diguanylate cyclase